MRSLLRITASRWAACEAGIAKINLLSFEGRFIDSSDENLQQLKAGALEVSADFFAPYLSIGSNKNSADVREHDYIEAVHPITGSQDTYCVQQMSFNQNQRGLRTTKIVRQLRTKLNS